jgi:hypothetical protein
MKKIAIVLAHLAHDGKGLGAPIGVSDESWTSSQLADAAATGLFPGYRIGVKDKFNPMQRLATFLLASNPAAGLHVQSPRTVVPSEPRASNEHMFYSSTRPSLTGPQPAVLQQSYRVRGLMPVMALKTGIVGLPNVGKSTLFNALTGQASAEAANYPFCTIEPNTGIISVPDTRLDALVKLSDSQKTVPTILTMVDIAGLVEGASKGEGLGNKFLSNIRECDAIVHVVRCFEDENVVHVSGSIDPLRDMEVISLELSFADLAQVQNRLAKMVKDVKTNKEGAKEEQAALQKVEAVLDSGQPARKADLTEDEWKAVKHLQMLSAKPVVYATNVADTDLADGNEMVNRVKEFALKEGARTVTVSAQVESELVDLDEAEKVNFLSELGVEAGETGLQKLIREVYQLLKLRTYFTTGPEESRAWTIKEGMLAPQAAGVIHTDFEKGFIKAETVAYNDLIEAGSLAAAKDAGKVRQEGKEYEVNEADVLNFKFNTR